VSEGRTRNPAASIQQRLLNHTRETGEDFQVTLNNYLLERFLYRLGQSPARSRFVLKGAMLFRLWADTPYRATLDLDLSWRGAGNREAIAEDIRLVSSLGRALIPHPRSFAITPVLWYSRPYGEAHPRRWNP